MSLIQSQIDKCKQNEHLFEYIDYVPDFDHKCYRLQFRCEYCGVEVSDKVKEKEEEKQGNKHANNILDTQNRYWEKPNGVCIQIQQELEPTANCISGACIQ